MKLYRFSPIMDEKCMMKASAHIHFACHALCKQSLGKYLPVAGNIGIFCHYDGEYEQLIKIQKRLTDVSDSVFGKYFRLLSPITVKAKNDVPTATYTHLYIRKPDPYRSQVGDIDFYMEPDSYAQLKQSIRDGNPIKGARVFPRTEDMIELFNPDVDCFGYIRTQ